MILLSSSYCWELFFITNLLSELNWLLYSKSRQQIPRRPEHISLSQTHDPHCRRSPPYASTVRPPPPASLQKKTTSGSFLPGPPK
ncbi:hypothetical protein SISSUDRAFT_254580 [Sistotremastrum suecicum HHB10207 ss-3]|uniref:Uncharacterized protein n=1 Tax=Sistotremastrum suecicum HHB10207 ss-3 TaxID=1314776 RepID=A0A165ZVF7_9AGAM|nr:hypothetical protein SISSUDRAFT_254580 [Sistotremastrum suecicum HHB10207 ss-3]